MGALGCSWVNFGCLRVQLCVTDPALSQTFRPTPHLDPPHEPLTPTLSPSDGARGKTRRRRVHGFKERILSGKSLPVGGRTAVLMLIQWQCSASQGVFYPSGRQRWAIAGTYKSLTRQVTRQKPSTTRQVRLKIIRDKIMGSHEPLTPALPVERGEGGLQIAVHLFEIRSPMSKV